MAIPAGLGMWSANTIVKTLAKKFPKVAPYINKAQAAGFLAPSILKKLMGTDSEFHTEAAEREQDRKKTKRNATLGALGLAGGLGAASLAGRGIGASAQAAAAVQNPIIPPPPGRGGGGAGNTPPGPAQAQGGLLSPVPGGPIPTQPNNPTQAGSGGIYTQGLNTNSPPDPNQQANQARHEKYDPIAENLPTKTEQDYPHLPNFVKRMQESGKEAEEIYDLAKQSPLLGPLVQKVEAETGQPYLERIKRSGQQKPNSSGLDTETSKTPVKGDKVMTSEGLIGDIADTKKTHGLVSVNGIHHQVRLDNVEPIPKEWENLHVDLSSVPEEDKSAQLSFVAPTDDKKELLTRFWKGHKPVIYVYSRKDGNPIDDETLYNISNEVDAPITNGMAFSGAWTETGKSRGGAFHKRVKELAQHIDDPDDPTKPYVFKRANITYEHGMFKAVHKELLNLEEKWDAVKKPKKRKTKK